MQNIELLDTLTVLENLLLGRHKGDRVAPRLNWMWRSLGVPQHPFLSVQLLHARGYSRNVSIACVAGKSTTRRDSGVTPSDPRDPTLMGNQDALRTSSGAIWLIVGAIFVVICGGLLLALNSLQHPVGFIGAGIVAVLYLAMLVVARVVRHQRARLVTLAVLMLAIAAVGLAFVLVISAAEAAVIA